MNPENFLSMMKLVSNLVKAVWQLTENQSKMVSRIETLEKAVARLTSKLA